MRSRAQSSSAARWLRATEKGERHRATTGAVTSPLAGLAYDPRSGALDLHRFVESPVDTAVGEFTASYEKLGSEQAGDIRAALSMDDFYTLLAFARRSVLASLPGAQQSLPSLRARRAYGNRSGEGRLA